MLMLHQPFLCWPSHQHERSSRLTLTTPTHEVVHWRNPCFRITISARNMIPIPSKPRTQSALLHPFGSNFLHHHSPAFPVLRFLPPSPLRNSSLEALNPSALTPLRLKRNPNVTDAGEIRPKQDRYIAAGRSDTLVGLRHPIPIRHSAESDTNLP